MTDDRRRWRSRSRSREPSETNMPLTLVVPHHISTSMNDENIINRIVQNTGTTIRFIETTHSPDLADSLFLIEGKTFESKIAGFEALVEKMLSFGLNSDRMSLRIAIPSSLVCMLIGKRGKHVECIQKSTSTSISVEDPKVNFAERIVSIDGNSNDCLTAARQIYGKFLNKGSQEPMSSSKLTYKFIVPSYMQNDFTTTFKGRLRSEHNVDFKVKIVEIDRSEEVQAVSLI